ncbi:hypothetical protein [Acinetobacter sp. SA01]|uniref:hypothetical protein n=1 Tax=Acinetobacter sp. SA01 TaxID=1862567 RepID=UPI0014080150|nr:hypothetical protein [Acinetobacter sp. SA01]
MSNTFLFGEDLREQVAQDIKLSQLKSEKLYKEMELLCEWDKFMISMKLYFIQYRHLNNLLKELNLIDREMPISDKKERILEAKSIIRRIISNFTEDDLLVFENKSLGHKGLKNAVFEKLTISEYRKYFESNKTNFKNRWDEVRRENSHQNSRHK